MANSREKGKRGERELAKVLREYGFDARRGEQYCGANGDADVVGVPGFHIECKRTEQLRMYDALEQASNDAREGETPVVMHRKNGEKWVAVMELPYFIELVRDTCDARIRDCGCPLVSGRKKR